MDNIEAQMAVAVYEQKKKKKFKEKRDKALRVRFSIRTKLVTIISILVLLSLGSITFLVSWLVSQDLQITAEENNFEVNQRAATLVEQNFTTVRSASRLFLRTLHSFGGSNLQQNQTAGIFFEENPLIAAIVYTSIGQQTRSFTNNRFFLNREIEHSQAERWLESQTEFLQRGNQGQTMLFNVSADFGIPMMVLVFPWQEGAGAVALFSSEALSDTICYGLNRTYLVNGEDDILIHADFDMVRAGANISKDTFIRTMRSSPQPIMQTVFADDEGKRHFGAFTKLDIGAAAVITSIEYDKVFEGLMETTRRNIYLTAIVLSLSIIVIWFFAKSISIPLKKLSASARAIEGGAFEVNLHFKNTDEIGVLTASFKKMSSALGIFGKFTNRDLAIQAMRGQLKPGGLPKHATIFFSDIRGFTSKTEAITNEFGKAASDKVVFWLNNYLTSMVECVEKTGGVVDKFIGDAVMAHWGTAYTSGSPRQDAYNCIRAALLMRAAVVKMNRQRIPGDKSDPSITIGCGINTGIVTAGQVGSDLRMEYTVIGDPVNLASRVESLTKEFGADILISEDTWKLVKDHLIVEEMPSVSVKGKEKPVRVFAVINLKSNPKGPRTLAEVRKILGIEPPKQEKAK
ncbi:MAG: adenylate/guanylate cyclase domain-containing protein [Treponema sp.]|jgi:adenylate cyclase|nr:adenylate/guanylate cyclase domain-containing protein [Treponema sp.]